MMVAICAPDTSSVVSAKSPVADDGSVSMSVPASVTDPDRRNAPVYVVTPDSDSDTRTALRTESTDTVAVPCDVAVDADGRTDAGVSMTNVVSVAVNWLTSWPRMLPAALALVCAWK